MAKTIDRKWWVLIAIGTGSFRSALSDELVELDSRIDSTEIGLVDYDLAVTGERIRELLIEGRSIRNKMDTLTSELRPLMVPSSGSAHRKRIVELKNEIADTRHLVQVNARELTKAELDEQDLTVKRNELMGVKPEPIPEPGSKSYAHLYPI
jgi:predicted  nucleic acid-binding Zn-ribbon protein